MRGPPTRPFAPDMEPPGLPPDLLKRYLAGQCSEAERQRVDAWYEALDRPAPQPLAFDERRGFERLRASLSDDSDFGKRPVRPLWQRPWAYLTATAAAAVLVGGLLFWPQSNDSSLETVAKRTGSTPVAYQNSTQKISRRTLPDGSVVWLKPGARLAYAPSANGSQREVTFSGEAFFEVARDPAHPFVIRSGRMTTQVLGTSFNVKAVPNAVRYEVTVRTGRVAVRTAATDGRMKTVLLTPRQRAVFHLPSSQLAKTTVPSRLTDQESWQPVSLAFDDATLDEVARQLEQRFDVRIRLANPALRHCRLTVDLTQQSLPEILDIVTKLLGTDYAWQDGTVTLKGSGCEN